MILLVIIIRSSSSNSTVLATRLNWILAHMHADFLEKRIDSRHISQVPVPPASGRLS